MINSYIFYVLLSLLILLLAVLAGKTKNVLFAVFIVIVLSFVSGFRAYSVGSDTESYVKIFNTISQGGSHPKDIGFNIVCKFLLNIYNNPTFLFLIFATITYSFITARLWELNKGTSFTYSIFAFYSFYFFETMNIMRQFVVVAVIFYATRYLAKRKYFTYLIFVLPCILFHFSAVLGLLFFISEFLFWKSLNKKQKRFLICCVILGGIFFVLLLPVINQEISKYLHYFDTLELDIGLRIFALIFVFILSLLLNKPHDSKRRLVSDVQDNQYVLSTTKLYYLFACLFGFVGYLYEFMDRLGFYFMPFVFAYFGIIVKEKNSTYRAILKLTVALLIAYILFNYIFVLNGSNHHPYKFIWE